MGGWEAALAGARRDAAIEAASEVARRFSDPARVREAVEAARLQSDYPRNVGWAPYGVAQGDAGVAVALAYLDRCFPEAGWDAAAHGFLVSAARSAEGIHLPPSLFGGLAGLGFAAMSLSRDGARYARLLGAIEGELVRETHVLAQTVRGRRAGLAVNEFDAIAGLAGVSAYLLAHPASPALRAALKHTVQALVELVLDPGEGLPRWVTPPELMPDETAAARYPDGALNCGLAHGIPGPLAVMALALSAGVPVDRLGEAVDVAARWVTDHRCDDQWGVNWPTMVTVPEGRPGLDQPSRAAWCYGSPGVARALWLAGTALSDEALRRLAVEAMECVYRRPIGVRYIDSPTFCHGVAGLLQITLRFLHDTQLPVFAGAVADLTDQLLEAYEPGSLLGFRCLEPGRNRVDHPGLLDGAPGVALVLLAAATPVEPTWDRLFLLS